MIFWGINDNLNIPSTKLHNIFTYCNNFTAIYSKNALRNVPIRSATAIAHSPSQGKAARRGGCASPH